MAITQSQMRMLQRRRTSDVDRLAQQYKKNVEALTGDFESSFAQFQKQRAETMAPYEAELEKYKTEIYPDYERQVESYRQRLDAYNALIKDIEADPVIERRETVVTGKTWYGKKKYGEAIFYDPKPIPTFTEKAPEAPAAPVAPALEKFDTTKFEQRKTALDTEFQREIGERRSGRLAAVSRRTRRPMLQGE